MDDPASDEPPRKLNRSSFGDGPEFAVDADQEWQYLLSVAPEVQFRRIAEQWHWVDQLHWSGLPWEEQERFWHPFAAEDACKNRLVALIGIAAASHSKALALLNSALEESGRRADAIKEGRYGDHERTMLAVLGIQFAELVDSGDHDTLGKMAAILKAGALVIPKNHRGGEYSDAGIMLRAFCKLHLATRSLPTKKQLRTECGIGDSDEELAKAKRLRKHLGLSGLPEGRSSGARK
jgi:hypothetical protein